MPANRPVEVTWLVKAQTVETASCRLSFVESGTRNAHILWGIAHQPKSLPVRAAKTTKAIGRGRDHPKSMQIPNARGGDATMERNKGRRHRVRFPV